MIERRQSSHGKRESGAGLTRGQRIRRRVLLGAVVVSLLIIIGWLFLNAWIRMPKVPQNDNIVDNSNAHLNGNSFELDGAEIPAIALSGRKEGVYTFLVVGKDTAGGGNTDTMILITYDTVNQTIHGMNLPRDTMVNVSTRNKKLNAVYNYNKGKDKATQVEKGMTALKNQVGKLTGIVPDYYIIVEWEAVGELVDALGGVWFEVPFNMDYDDPTPGQDLHIHQAAGYRKLTGDDAMQVIRHRKNNDGSHSNGDVGRLKIQQDFLMAVAQECLQVKTLLKAPALAKIFMENVTTDLDLGYLLGFAQAAYGMDAEQDVSFVTMPYVGYNRNGSYVLPVGKELVELLNQGFNPYTKDITAADLQLMYKTGNGGVNVTNGTLADPSLASAPVQKPKPQPEEPDGTEPATDPSGSQTPEDPDGSNTQQPPDPLLPVDPAVPNDPAEPAYPSGSQGSGPDLNGEEEVPSQDIPGDEAGGEDPFAIGDIFPQPATSENVTVLPTPPEPAESGSAA